MDCLNYIFSSFEPVRFGSYLSQYINNRKLTDIYHSHNFYEIIEIIDGNAKMILNEVCYTLRQNTIVFMRPGDRHKFVGQSTNLKLFSISICINEFEKNLDFYDNSLLNYILSLEMPIIENTQYPCISNDFVSASESSNYEYRYKVLLAGFIKVIADSKYLSSNKISNSVQYAMSEMKKTENLKAGIEQFVKFSGYSRAQLSRIIKKSTGLTLQEYIANLRLEAAYNMLILTQESTESIADKVGYSSLSHFSKIFTQKYHMTPACVRKTKSILTI